MQSEADAEWARQVSTRPGCEELFTCLQCGACSGACPLSIYMDYTPRRVINLVREGFRTDVLGCATIWLCASCYSCGVHCPQKIHLTDVMYTLKREAIREGLYPRRLPIPALAQEFYRIVASRGRSSEFLAVLRMALRSNPFILLKMLPSGWRLLRAGRMPFRADRVRDLEQFRDYLHATEET